MAPYPGTPVSLCPLIVLHPPSHLLTLNQSSPAFPSLLHHPDFVHVGPSPCLSSWGSRTHTMLQPPDIHKAQRASEISACHVSLCLCPESCFITFSLFLKSRDLQSIMQKVLNRANGYFAAAVLWVWCGIFIYMFYWIAWICTLSIGNGIKVPVYTQIWLGTVGIVHL